MPMLQNAFGQKFVIEKEDEGFHRTVVETDDMKYKIDADADQFDSDLPGGGFETIIIKNTDSQGAKNFKLEAGENAKIDFKIPEGTQKNDCEATDHGAYELAEVYSVDKNEKDLDIIKGQADKEEEIADEICDIKLDNCDLEFDVPNDTDEGKYRFVIEAIYDEGSAFFINKVKIKE